nr:MAG TPA: hypothetical protein [Caudoviricetes sp.]
MTPLGIQPCCTPPIRDTQDRISLPPFDINLIKTLLPIIGMCILLT